MKSVTTASRPGRAGLIIGRLSFWLCFSIYLYVLINLLFFNFGRAQADMSYREYFELKTNFIPFLSIYQMLKAFSTGDFGTFGIYSNVLGNFALFAPMGMFLPCISRRLDKFSRTIPIVVGMIVLVEGLQFLTRRGSMDVDDLILNGTGAIAGYACLYIRPFRRLLLAVNWLPSRPSVKPKVHTPETGAVATLPRDKKIRAFKAPRHNRSRKAGRDDGNDAGRAYALDFDDRYPTSDTDTETETETDTETQTGSDAAPDTPDA